MTDLERAVKVFDPFEIDLHEAAEGGHSDFDYEVHYDGEKWINYTAEVVVHHGVGCWVFEAVNVTKLEFGGMNPSFTISELEIAIEEARFNY